MSASRRGIERERTLLKQLRAEGWLVVRAAGSLGVADLLAVRAGEIRVIEVKSTAANPWASFGPADRRALLDAAEIAGGEAWLYWHPPRREPRWIGPDEWPPTP